MAQEPGLGHSTFYVTHHLGGMHFPASKRGLLLHARDNGAGQDVLEVLESLPDDENFEDIAGVMKACSNVDQVPQTGILGLKP
jgi:hypothetical protein